MLVDRCETPKEEAVYKNKEYHSSGFIKSNGYEHSNALSNNTDNSPLKSLRILLRQFDTGEKRQWPNYLQDLTKLFMTSSFMKAANEKPGRVIDDVTRVFTRVLTTKLFPDIIQQMVVCLSTFSSTLCYNCRELFNWIFDLYNEPAVPDETRLVLIKSLVMIVENGGKGLYDQMPSLMNKVKRALEEADTCELLFAITDIFLATAKNCSSLLQVHFRDVVDILIGWHIDSSQSSAITQMLAKALISFNYFWINDLDFSLTLLGHFLEDFESHFDELMESEKNVGVQPKSPKSRGYTGNGNLSTNERLAKMASLVRVYITVLQSLGDYASPERNSAITWDFIVNSLRSFLTSVNCTIEFKLFESLVIATNECAIFTLELMSGHEPSLIDMVTEQLLVYLCCIENWLDNVSDAFIITTLKLMTRFVKEVNVNLPVEFVSSILSPSSMCQKLRFMPSSRILTSLYELHHSLLGLKNIPLMEEAYKCFLMDMEIAYSTLSQPVNLVSCEQLTTNTVTYNEKQAVIAVTSALISLTEIANTKNSLIGMWALKPTFFNLIIQHSDPANDTLTLRYPNIQYSLIYILYSHSNKHKHFIQSSVLVNNIPTSSHLSHSPMSTSSFTTASLLPQPSSGHLSKILVLLTSLLKKEKLKKISCLLSMNWATEILQFAQQHLNHLCSTNEMCDLLEAIAKYAFSNDSEICLKSCQAFELVLKSVDEFPKLSVLNKYFCACMIHIAHTNHEVRSAYLNLFAILPLNCYTQTDIFWKSKCNILFPELKNAKLMIMKKEPSSSFSAVSFRTIVSFVLENQPLCDQQWLRRLFHVCQSDDNTVKSIQSSSSVGGETNQSKLMTTFDCNENALVFWACWEVVQYCIVNRLRTPLGKAQDTFTKIEMAIKGRALDVQTNNKKTTKDLLQVKMLLLLMENLDKSMYNAIDGCAARLYTTPKTAKTFFRTNKTTCVDWMNRNRKNLMVIALRSGDYASVWRNGQELLKDMISKSYWNELEFILAMIVQALIQLGDADSIAGLYVWAREICSSKYPWIKGSVEETNGRYENALEEYTKFYVNATSSEANNEKNESAINDFVNQRILECYLSLGHWEAATCWSSNYQPTHHNVFTSNVDVSYLKHLTSFDLYEKLSEPEDKSMLWDTNTVFHECQKNLLFATSNLINNNHETDVAKNLLQDVYDKTSQSLVTSSLCTPALLDNKVAILHRSAYSLLSTLNKEEKQFKWIPSVINSNGDIRRVDCSTLVYAHSWIKASVDLIPTQPNSAKDSINELVFVAAKAARKKQNLKLAQNLMLKYASNAFGTESHPLNNFLNVVDMSRLVSTMNDVVNKPEMNKELVAFQCEGSKLLNAVGNTKAGIDILLKCVENLNKNTFMESNQALQEMWLKSALSLVKLFKADNKYLEQLYTEQSSEILSLMNSNNNEVISSLSVVSKSESIIGNVLALTSNRCPQLAKACLAMGAWSHKWGRRLQDRDEVEKNSSFVWIDDGSFSFYKLAANAYFQYLRLGGTGCDDSNVTATLRLLRLFVKHAPELREILEDGLANTPTAPWKSIILQLFARLGHSEPYVRQSISDLLCRIGQDSPHLIVFPAVAGSLTSDDDLVFNEKVNDKVVNRTATSFDPDDNNVFNEDDEDEEEDEKQDISLMQNCYAALVNSLSVQNPELIMQTKTFVHELRRITILWDELWMGTLIGHMSEMKKQVTNLDEEIAKVHKNVSLSNEEKELFIAEKHRIFFRKVVYVLEQCQIITGEPPETPHESLFQRTFSKAIANALKVLKSPNDPSKPQQSLLVYQQLIQLLQKSIQWNSGRSQLVMDTISPILATMDNTVIPLPGLENQCGKLVTISRVCKTVCVLHTKTKPKKLVFSGSDGKMHPYLLKGHEDLHLDERVMQFLSIVNKMLAKHYNNKQDKALFRARNYSVTPLGTKSGLIQWVDGGSALYGFYKRWMLNRDTTVPLTKGQVAHKITPQPNDNLYKPSEIFAKKLTAKGITTTNRSDWPKTALVQILQELIQETPGDLIAKELWCSSTNAHEYWKLTQAFTHSNAVMCMTGYVIGLGDRHLDNVLVDLSTGEVIHIDYNICFEKGRTLRVPERVPCRLTNNIVNAFGLTGVEGTFRISCEHVIRVLRKGKETLLTLLDAFLYDPLIDWTPGHEEGYTGAVYGGGRINALKGKSISKLQMEKENAKAMLRVRVAETKVDWMKLKERLLSLMTAVEEKVKEVENTKFVIEGKREVKKSSTSLWGSLHDKVTQFKAVNNGHNQLLAEVKHLIRILSKIEERELKSNKGPVTQYYSNLRKFTESMPVFVRELEASTQIINELDNAKQIDLLKNRIKSLRNQIPDVYDELLDFNGSLHKESDIDFVSKQLTKEGSQSETQCVDNDKTEKIVKQVTGAERNTYALNVWKRVKMKLEGKDLDATKRSSIPEQVDYIIKQSMDIENLALMYEGWTSWV
ncbi:serine/threonine-protein kinase-like protein 4 [Leptotrombidium deliense]|uniref:non-specific serine/threonine protein kinase n=1 Tax=Leptotrombidium deliense TaxID=299467 RepID=A0A443SNQ7_9ACAR|nr:serine/threonine-protein kinase-like protein 4 [Leptotrombidium deliense]